MFGDPSSHEQYMNSQYKAYVNRFGSGMVIYWFGFVDSIVDQEEKDVLVMDGFPSADMILTMDSLLQEKW